MFLSVSQTCVRDVDKRWWATSTICWVTDELILKTRGCVCTASVQTVYTHAHTKGPLMTKWAYLSGVAPGIGLPEEGVRQLPHPHGQGARLSGRLAGVHHGAEQGLQLRLRVPADVHDLLPGRRRAAVRVHVAKSLVSLQTCGLTGFLLENAHKSDVRTCARVVYDRCRDASPELRSDLFTLFAPPLPSPPHTPSELFVSLCVCFESGHPESRSALKNEPILGRKSRNGASESADRGRKSIWAAHSTLHASHIPSSSQTVSPPLLTHTHTLSLPLSLYSCRGGKNTTGITAGEGKNNTQEECDFRCKLSKKV